VREFLEAVIRLPMPFMLCAGLGLLCWPRPRLHRALFAIAALGPLVLGLPILGKLLLAAQIATVSLSLPEEPPVAILVPVGGMYKVGSDQWWPSAASVERLSQGLALAARYGPAAPVVVAGGAPWPGAPVEATVLLARVATGNTRIEVDPASGNTAETAEALRMRFPEAHGATVVAATDRFHAARMAASLRNAGFQPIIALSDKYRGIETRTLDFVPQPEGLFLNSRVLRSWSGLIWYLILGKIAPGDLASHVSPAAPQADPSGTGRRLATATRSPHELNVDLFVRFMNIKAASS
jgi:uncharacterized SAM-binding protein YcdF (DUF218 family)